jgi:hypothetical protein
MDGIISSPVLRQLNHLRDSSDPIPTSTNLSVPPRSGTSMSDRGVSYRSPLWGDSNSSAGSVRSSSPGNLEVPGIQRSASAMEQRQAWATGSTTGLTGPDELSEITITQPLIALNIEEARALLSQLRHSRSAPRLKPNAGFRSTGHEIPRPASHLGFLREDPIAARIARDIEG